MIPNGSPGYNLVLRSRRMQHVSLSWSGSTTQTEAAVERAMKVQGVIMKAMAKKITWWQAAEILGIHVRTMRRWRGRMERDGFKGLLDRRKHPSPKRVPLKKGERV